ncbi:EEF1A lysine methyltransferase 2-like [Homarus americanus]|uniref:Protein-lysine N-methyltransferase Hamer_G016093 n=1 Tax=Homarus americanus TaxID=6706 RepID=A0A8J5KGF5_HOMAM|nr:EEF1A lysine methyltransferase 2-like [Homarus americanus]
MTEETEELPSSKLGTKEYWDSAYNHELSNYKRNGDIGDVWFGEESIERVVTWMLESALVNVQSSVVDLGCGNGAFLLYLQVDLINDEDKEKIKTSEFDVTHDKGTYDAVSLCPEDPKSKRLSYIKAVHRITKENGLFIITSCNWVHHELIEHFSEYFSKEHIIPTPTFKFGGKVGTQVTCIVFRKVSK